MSKERKILKKILVLYREDKSCMDWRTANEIQVLLDKPELSTDSLQLTEQEPVAWGDEEIKALYDRHAFAMESDEYMWGFRDAEKAHGITGDEE